MLGSWRALSESRCAATIGDTAIFAGPDIASEPNGRFAAVNFLADMVAVLAGVTCAVPTLINWLAEQTHCGAQTWDDKGITGG